MKPLNVLKTLIDLFLFFSILGAIAVIIAVPMKLINPNLEIPISIKGVEVSGSDWSSMLVILLAAIGAFFFVYAIFVLRKVILLFLKRDAFNENVVTYFKLIGKCIIASAVLTSVPMFFYDMFHHSKVWIEFTGGGFDSLILSLSLGLLFIVIGEIFDKAKEIKEEKELTV